MRHCIEWLNSHFPCSHSMQLWSGRWTTHFSSSFLVAKMLSAHTNDHNHSPIFKAKPRQQHENYFFSCFQSLSLFEYTNTCRPDKRDHSCFSEVRYVGAEDGTFNIMVYYTIYRGVANDWLSSNQHFKAVNFHFSDYNSSMEVQQPLIFDSGSLRDQLSPQHSGAFFHDCKQVKLHFEKYSRNTTHLLWQSRRGELCR